MGLAFVPVYINYLGIEAYGLIGIFAMLQAWLTLLDMGMTPTISREMARFTGGAHDARSIRDLLRSVELIALGVAGLIAVGIWTSSTWLASEWLRVEALPAPEVAQAFNIMGVVTAFRFIEGIYRSSIVGLQRQVVLNVVNSAMATIRGLGAIGVLAWISPGIEAFFLWQGFISLVTLLLFARLTYLALPRGDHPGRFSADALKDVWRYAAGMIGITFFSAAADPGGQGFAFQPSEPQRLWLLCPGVRRGGGPLHAGFTHHTSFFSSVQRTACQR